MKKVESANFPQFELEMIEMWMQEETFAKSLANRRDAKRYSFYDGPPFANGLPHFGHSLVTSIKDAIGRYRTMRGFYVERRNGWDCHGLPVEFAIEKKFGVSGKKQIMELGLEKFNAACRESVFAYKGEWEDFFARIGRWTEAERAYATIDRSYTESVWWSLKQVHDKNLLYKGYKSMPYCPRCETPISNFELNEGYKDNVSDPSVYVKFSLVDSRDTSFLVWTTTPWTLPANAALAVDAKADYVLIEMQTDTDAWKKGERLILAKKRLEHLAELFDSIAEDYKVVATHKGEQLLGKRYLPLFEFAAIEDEEARHAWQIYADESVSLEDGTGILHVAPRYGEADLEIGQRHRLPLIESVDQTGHMAGNMGEWGGVFFKDADPHIIAHLTEKGSVFLAETFTHTYPFCYRCDSPLLYFAISTWFIAVSKIRDSMLATAKQIEWTPGHIKEGRFGKWLEGAKDWGISRNRYWGAPLPIWVNEEDESDYLVVGSIEELERLASKDAIPEDLHRPYIDKVVIKKNGKTYRRIEEVFDCWFESGSMPVAQQHYPFENKEVFEQSFPADYIGEGLDQTRLWFYVQHVLSTILFDRPAYKHVLVNGIILAADGQKLSKRLKNYPPVEEVFAEEGADSLRLYLLGNDQVLNGDYMRFDRSAMKDIQRNVFLRLWNVVSFFTTYAEIDSWQPPKGLQRPQSQNVLDEWILARLDAVIAESTEHADNYRLARAIRLLRDLIDDLSNWYVRRSRRRFWKSEDDTDKTHAYETLHYVLLRICQLLAPWSPFVADKIWRSLTEGMEVPTSVHLSDWPEVGDVDTGLLTDMAAVREVIAVGLAQRAEQGIKVRQPLSMLRVSEEAVPHNLTDSGLMGIIAEEVNVKKVVVGKGVSGSVELDTQLTDSLRREGNMRELIRHIQNFRKTSGLNVEDRIKLAVNSDSAEISKTLQEYGGTIKTETLAIELGEGEYAQKTEVKIDGQSVGLSLEKA